MGIEQNTSPPPSDYLLEMAALGQVPDSLKAEWNEARKNPHFQDQVRDLQSQTQSRLAEHAPEQVSEQIIERMKLMGQVPRKPAQSKRWKNSQLMIFATPVLALGLLLIFMWPRMESTQNTEPQGFIGPLPEVLPKGPNAKEESPHLRLFLKNDSGAKRELNPLDKVQANDLVQVGYVNTNYQHGLIFSVDGNCYLTPHFPAPGQSDTRLAPKAGTTHLLDFAYRLDNAPKHETFYLVTAQKSLSPEVLLPELKRLGCQTDSEQISKIIRHPVTISEFKLIKSQGERP